MKYLAKLLTALLLLLVLTFNIVSCDIFSIIQGGTGENTDDGGNSDGNQDGGNSDGTDDEDDYVFGEEYPCISITESMLIA